jgi:hypothetical protein
MFILFFLLLFFTRKRLKDWFGDSKDEK